MAWVQSSCSLSEIHVDGNDKLEICFYFRETRHEGQITNNSWYASFHFSFVDKITEFPEKILQNKAVFEISGAVISKSKI